MNRLQLIKEEHRSILFWIMGGVCTVAFTSYVLFMNLTIFQLIETKAYDTQIKAITDNITLLEQEYLSRSQQVTTDIASQLGYEKISTVDFISEDGKAGVLTIRELTESRSP